MNFAARPQKQLSMYYMGMPFCQKCVGTMQGKNPEMLQCSDIFSMFRLLVDRLSGDELEKWATVSWAIWTVTNKFYFEKVQQHPKRILGRGPRLLGGVS